MFFSKQIPDLKRRSFGRDVIHEKYPSKTWHEKLKMYPMKALKLEI